MVLLLLLLLLLLLVVLLAMLVTCISGPGKAGGISRRLININNWTRQNRSREFVHETFQHFRGLDWHMVKWMYPKPGKIWSFWIRYLTWGSSITTNARSINSCPSKSVWYLFIYSISTRRRERERESSCLCAYSKYKLYQSIVFYSPKN